ncbi:MAG: flagellar hook protein FlgE [Bryobacterales bacterium]|nr:flagellar hook protein FlgE [Bryobacterales bacterium]
MAVSFATALAGLTAHAIGIDAVGNNLANLNTSGYKASTVAFRDLVTQSIGVGNEAGLGTSLPRTTRHFTQGSVQSSTGAMDAAIKGDGFFIVRSPSQNTTAYTRAGNFQVDRDGFLIMPTGDRVQGWSERDGVLNTNQPTSDVTIPTGALQRPAATTLMFFDMNLDAAAEQGATFSTPIEVFDSLGVSHVLVVEFERVSPTAWDFRIFINGEDLDPPQTDLVLIYESDGSSQLQFDNQGVLTQPLGGVTGITNTGVDGGPLLSGAADLDIEWQFESPNGQPRFTQYAHPSAVSGNGQNGNPAAQLVKIAMEDGGVVVAQFSNGQTRQVAQVALAGIRNPESLRAIGNNLFQVSSATALPAIGRPDTGGRGQVLGGALESSNVDIAKEFTNLIVYQRGYQANSRMVVTADEISQETINLKR